MWVQLIHSPQHWYGLLQVSAFDISALTLHYNTSKVSDVALEARRGKVKSL